LGKDHFAEDISWPIAKYREHPECDRHFQPSSVGGSSDASSRCRPLAVGTAATCQVCGCTALTRCRRLRRRDVTGNSHAAPRSDWLRASHQGR